MLYSNYIFVTLYAICERSQNVQVQCHRCNIYNNMFRPFRSYNGSFFALIINMGSRIYTHTSSNLFGPLGMDSDVSVVTASIISGYYQGYGVVKY